MKISLGADHGGFELKNKIYDLLISRGVIVLDHGCNSTDPVDYPDHAKAVAEDVSLFAHRVSGSALQQINSQMSVQRFV